MAAPLRKLVALRVVSLKEMLRTQSARRLDDAISCAFSPSMFNMSALPRLRAALSSLSF